MISQEKPNSVQGNGQETNLKPDVYVIMGARMWSPSADKVGEIITKMSNIISMYRIPDPSNPDNLERSFVATTADKRKMLDKLKEEYGYFVQPADIQEKWNNLEKKIFEIEQGSGEELLLNDFEWPILLEDATNSKGGKEFVTGEARLETAIKIYKENPNSIFFTTGGRGFGKGEGKGNFDKAIEYAEAASRKGIDKSQLIPLTQFPINTEGDAKATGDYLRSHPEKFPSGTNVNLITSDYHIMRCWLLFSKDFYEDGGKNEWSAKISLENKKGAVTFLAQKIEELLKLKKGNKLMNYTSDQMLFDFEVVKKIFEGSFNGSKYFALPKVVEKELGGEESAETANEEKRNVLIDEYIAVIKLILGNDWLLANIKKTRLDPPDIPTIVERLNQL